MSLKQYYTPSPFVKMEVKRRISYSFIGQQNASLQLSFFYSFHLLKGKRISLNVKFEKKLFQCANIVKEGGFRMINKKYY